jgi:hypothetical protein
MIDARAVGAAAASLHASYEFYFGPRKDNAVNFQILPRHEPDGEGNGWETCSEALASAFLVVDLRTDEDVEVFDTRAQAQAYVNSTLDPERPRK